MKISLALPLGALLAVAAPSSAAAPASAASPFDGTWKTDIATVKLTPKPDILLLQNGSFSCRTCIPPVTVPADGQFHAVTGHDYYDSIAVKVLGPRHVTAAGRKGGKLVFTRDDAISADGNTLTETGRRTNLVTGATTEGSSTSTRVAPAPAGAHALSGSWRATKIDAADAAGTTQTLKIVGETLTLSTPTGEGYTATFGGAPVLQRNDAGRTMVQVKRLAPDHIVETDTRGGKPVQLYDMVVAPGGRTMTMTVTDRRDNTTNSFTLNKQ